MHTEQPLLYIDVVWYWISSRAWSSYISRLNGALINVAEEAPALNYAPHSTNVRRSFWYCRKYSGRGRQVEVNEQAWSYHT